MSDCTHHWTVTSPCPFCQEKKIEALVAERDAAQNNKRVWWLPWHPQEVARRFHLAYEQFAPDFGYETRPDTKVFDPYSPNGQLMIAVVRNVLIEQASNHINDLERAEADLAALRHDLAQYVERDTARLAEIEALQKWRTLAIELADTPAVRWALGRVHSSFCECVMCRIDDAARSGREGV